MNSLLAFHKVTIKAPASLSLLAKPQLLPPLPEPEVFFPHAPPSHADLQAHKQSHWLRSKSCSFFRVPCLRHWPASPRAPSQKRSVFPPRNAAGIKPESSFSGIARSTSCPTGWARPRGPLATRLRNRREITTQICHKRRLRNSFPILTIDESCIRQSTAKRARDWLNRRQPR